MAKQSSGLGDLFKKTEQDPGEVDISDLEKGNIRSTGVGLREGEIMALDAIGDSLGGIARNALIRFAVRRFLIGYRAGLIDLSEYVEEPPPPKKQLRLPGEGE